MIAKNRDLRVVSGYRVLEFFRCDASAVLRCPDEAGYRRCGRIHAAPKVRDIMFDDLVRGTAAGEVAPLDFRIRSRTQRFWVPATHRDRYLDLTGSPAADPREPEPVGFASNDGPTCRPGTSQRPAPVRGATKTVNWNSSQHWSLERLPCRYCGTAVNLRDDQGRPSCKVCHEQRPPDRPGPPARPGVEGQPHDAPSAVPAARVRNSVRLSAAAVSAAASRPANAI